jgi:hypothetical protein
MVQIRRACITYMCQSSHIETECHNGTHSRSPQTMFAKSAALTSFSLASIFVLAGATLFGAGCAVDTNGEDESAVGVEVSADELGGATVETLIQKSWSVAGDNVDNVWSLGTVRSAQLFQATRNLPAGPIGSSGLWAVERPTTGAFAGRKLLKLTSFSDFELPVPAGTYQVLFVGASELRLRNISVTPGPSGSRPANAIAGRVFTFRARKGGVFLNNGASCGGNAPRVGATSCAPTSFCRVPVEGICGAADAPGVCTPKPQICNKAFIPVCGCDGNTYANACQADAAGMSVAKLGACAPAPLAEGAACGGRGQQGRPCEAGTFCEFSVAAACGSFDAPGSCVRKPDACAEIFAPICGCDGKTYGNACEAQLQEVSVAGTVACKK